MDSKSVTIVESQNLKTFDEQAAYDGIILALQSIQERRRSSMKGKESVNQDLRKTALDIERAEILRRGALFGLHKLDGTDHLFVRHTSDRSPYIREMKRRFEIMNVRGERVLFAVEETGYLLNAFSFSTVNEFDYSFIDPENGMEGFRLSSRTRLFGILGTVMRVFKDDDLLGSVLQTGHYGSTVFKILSRTGRIKYVIKPFEDYVEGIRPSFFQRLLAEDDIDIEFPSQFNIFSADESVPIGHITGTWDIHEEEFRSAASMSDSDEEELSSSSSSQENTDYSSGDEESESDSVSVSTKSSASSLSTSISATEVGQVDTEVSLANAPCVPFRILEDEFIETTEEDKDKQSTAGAEDDSKKVLEAGNPFSRERYERFLATIAHNNANWKWYFEGEHFGAEFNSELGSVSRAMIVAVILLQYFRIHYNRHHRRKSSRIMYRGNFQRWCCITGLICILAITVIVMDIYRDKSPN